MMATHRRFTPEFKVRVVLEIVSGAKPPLRSAGSIG